MAPCSGSRNSDRQIKYRKCTYIVRASAIKEGAVTSRGRAGKLLDGHSFLVSQNHLLILGKTKYECKY